MGGPEANARVRGQTGTSSGLFRSALFRSAVGLVAVLAALAIIVSTAFLWQTNRSLTQQAVASVLAEAEVYARLSRRYGFEAVRTVIAQSSSVPGAGLYLLQDEAGRMVAGNVAVFPAQLRDGGRGSAFTYRGKSGETRLAAGLTVRIGQGRLLVGRDVSEQLRLLRTLRMTAVIGFLALAAVGLVGGVVMSRMMLNRVEAMRSASQRLLASDLKGRLPVSGSGDELDRLAVSLNDMLARIERLIGSLRDVSENIAHDLKTPLNRLRNTAEAALCDPRGDEAHKEGLGRVIEAADDIIKTFNALLLIAKLESGVLEGLDEDVDAAMLLKDVGELYEPVAEEAGFALALTLSAVPLPVRGNRQLLGQAIANLIDNAIKYGRPFDTKETAATAGGKGAAGPRLVQATADGNKADSYDGRLAVGVLDHGAMLEIFVADNGTGIPRNERARVLERFVRLEKSRTKPGTGLGLSLVAAVARLHGGRLQLEDNAPGLKVRMLLPKADSRSRGVQEVVGGGSSALAQRRPVGAEVE